MAEETTKRPARRSERIGRYEIVDHLATGGMAVIYKARDVELDRVVALKVLPPEFATQKNTLIRFQREARAAALLRHENIVSIYDVGESNGTHFIALEFIDGTDLQDYINRKCQIDAEEARHIIIQSTRALEHAHAHGIVHRDIKPSNLLLTRKDDRMFVKLADFGLAIRYENEAEFRITRDKTTVGTVDYMSPEQARDSRSVDIRSDIYSLGCTFYHMLAGVAPFARGTLPERIVQHMQAPPPNLRKLNRQVPEYLAAIIGRMLAKNPEDRYQTPAELLHDLENPDAVKIAVPSGILVGKLERKRGRKRSADPTQLLVKEEKEDDEVGLAPLQVSVPKSKRAMDPPDEPADALPDVDEMELEERAPPPMPMMELPGSGEKTKKKAAPRSQPEPVALPPMWLFGVGGAIGVFILVVVIALMVGSSGGPKKDPEPYKNPPAPIVEIPDPKPEKPPVIDTSAAKMTVGPLHFPPIGPRLSAAELAAVRKEYAGPFVAFPEPPPGAAVLRVSRLAASGADTHRTLPAAFAAVKPKQFTIIEIHDDGPLFVTQLPALMHERILLRGGSGYRPLIVWDVARRPGKSKAGPIFCSIKQGQLILDNLDLVMEWTEPATATVFQLADTDFHARDCTFSIGGKGSGGVDLLRRVGNDNGSPRAPPRHVWLQRCYVRGADLTLLDIRHDPAEVFIEDSLIVGYRRPLIQVQARDDNPLTLYCARSTLVSGQMMLRWQSAMPKPGGAPIRARVFDSIFARDDVLAAPGDMVHLANVGDLSRMEWRAQNSVYAGWKQLLASDPKTIAGHDLDGWHRQWLYSLGDKAVGDTWPTNPPPALDEQPAEVFLPGESPVAFQSASGAGATGCVIGRLPAAPAQWVQRVFQPPLAGSSIPAGDWQPPTIETAKDGFYHGDRLDLNKVDLGAYLAEVVKLGKAAPRVVLHLTGRGACATSPIRVKGIGHLVLYFEPARNQLETLRLELNAAGITQRAPLFEMAGGHLDVIGATVQLSPVTLTPSVFKLHDANLTLTRCWLQGPLRAPSDGFQSLIAMTNRNGEPVNLMLRDNILLSGRLLFELNDNVQLKARNNVLISLGHAAQFSVNGATAPLTHVLDHNTWGARHSFFTLKTDANAEAGGPIRFDANSNAFFVPFDDVEATPTLLRGAERWGSRGRMRWQGRFNVFDARLHAYFGNVGAIAPGKQTLKDWQDAWGLAERQPALFTPAPGVRRLPLDNINPPAMLDRVILPRTLRGDPNQGPPGVDWNSVLKKKGL